MGLPATPGAVPANAKRQRIWDFLQTRHVQRQCGPGRRKALVDMVFPCWQADLIKKPAGLVEKVQAKLVIYLQQVGRGLEEPREQSKGHDPCQPL